jgi:hypothetical protein
MLGRCNGGDVGMIEGSLIRRYLLGDLSAEEQTRIEDEYFTDAERFEELVEAENDLIDSYVRGNLSDLEQQKFEQLYSNSPGRHTRIDFARSLVEIAPQIKEPSLKQGAARWWSSWELFAGRRGLLQLALVPIGFLMMAAIGLWLLIQNQRLRIELHHSQAERAELQRDKDVLAQQLAKLGKEAPQALSSHGGAEVAKIEEPHLPGKPESLRLQPGMLRDGGSREPTLRLPLHGSLIDLDLVLDQDKHERASYYAIVRTAEGRTVFMHDDLSLMNDQNEQAVVLQLPSRLIKVDDYVITLYSSKTKEEIASYMFLARKKDQAR